MQLHVRRFVSTTLLFIAAMAPLSSGQCQLVEFFASDGSTSAAFANKIALSGTTAVVSAERDDVNGNDSGSAYLFDITTGTQLFKLLANDGAADDWFGVGVGIDANYAVVGANQDDVVGTNSGSAYVFDVATGMQLHKLTPAGLASNDAFGQDVGIGAGVVIVGSRWDDDNGVQSGSAYLFDAATGNQLHKLTASDGAIDDNFGWSVATDGTKAIVAAWLDDLAGTDSGSAYIFDVATGNQLLKLIPSDGATSDQFGFDVAISGNLAVVGCRADDSSRGAAYVFDATTGVQLMKLVAPVREIGARFGQSVAIEGNIIVVGADLEDGLSTNSGAAYVFDATTFELIVDLRANSPQDLAVGRSVAVDGDQIALAAGGGFGLAANSGSGFGFDLGDLVPQFPGTVDDLEMNTLINGGDVPTCPSKSCSVGDQLIVGFYSPGGSLNFTIPLLLVQRFDPITPPTPVFPGIAVDPFLAPGPVVIIDGNNTSPVGQTLLTPQGLWVGAIVPMSLSGFNVLFQAYSLTPLASNGAFASTTAHVLSVN